MAGSLPRRLVAEALGTALLIVFCPGSVVAALVVGEGSLDYAGLGIIALSFGLVVAVVVYAFGSTSGAHINPAVTVTLAATGRFPWRDVVPYVGAQLLGSVLGGLLVIALFGQRAVDLGNGSFGYESPVTAAQAVTAEAVGTFLLVLAIMALAVDTRAPSGFAGLMIGLAVTGLVLVLGPISGANVNPARSFGPGVSAALFGGSVPWSQFPLYVLGPLLGGLAAAFTYDAVARPRDAAEAVEAPQGTQGEVVGERR